MSLSDIKGWLQLKRAAQERVPVRSLRKVASNASGRDQLEAEGGAGVCFVGISAIKHGGPLDADRRRRCQYYRAPPILIGNLRSLKLHVSLALT
jgi:hypothetical protein